MHIDKYGNYKINCNIPSESTNLVLSDNIRIPIVDTFEKVEVGQLLAYPGSSGMLEIAVREGNAAKSLGYEIGKCLEINFDYS